MLCQWRRFNFCKSLLYLMVLADSHTISKSIDNEEKVDDKFESINDLDRPTIPKTRKDRQHRYKVHYSKDDDVLQETKPYFKVEKATDRITVKPTPKAKTENAKRPKSPKKRLGFWKKLRGKDKKKETEKHDSKDRRRRISYHKEDSHKIAYLSTKPGLGLAKKKHRKILFLRQVSKRDASGLFSTRPYSNRPQSYKLQMGIAPKLDNTLKSKIKSVQPQTVAGATAGTWEVSENLQAQLGHLDSDISKLKERYGLVRSEVGSAPDNNPSTASSQGNITTTEIEFEGTAQIDQMVRAMKAKAIKMMSFQPSSVTELSNSFDTKAASDSNQPAPVSGFCALVSSNKIAKGEKRTVANTGTHAQNPKDSTIIYANTESHYLAARSIKRDAKTMAMNVEDRLQELKNLYNKVKHKVSNDFRKETHTVKSTLKEGYKKITSKLSSKSKTKITSSKVPSSTTNPLAHRTYPCKPKPLKMEGKPAPVLNPKPARTATSTITTSVPRVKKKDEKEEDRVEDSFTAEAYGMPTYDDNVMLTLYERMLSKSEDNARKLLSTPESPIYAKNKREARRLSKRNPETLTDVKLTEVVRNIYDDGGNMPDYDYIDPAANLSSAGRATASSNNNNDADYILEDSSALEDYYSQGSKPSENKPKLKGTSPGPRKDSIAADADNNASDSDNSRTVAYHTGKASGNPDSERSFQDLSNKICYNKYVDGYKHYLKFQQELKNENFSNLVKYQAHRHHSVDDIGKFILNKIPTLPVSKKRKRNLRFSDDSDNNMDYQEITTKSDDSWFRKHFYLFIDNGPPKKYHTSETVELKPGSVVLYVRDTTPATRSKGNPERSKAEVSIRIDSENVRRKAKNTKDISLDDLSKILDSIKNKGTNNLLTKATPPETQTEDTYINMDTYNATDEATMQDNSFIGKFFGVKRSHASNKTAVTTVYFPTTNHMYADNQQGRLKRSNTKETFANTLIADFMNNHIIEVKAATTATKEVFSDAARTSNRKTNKYGFVDIDLVPRQTAIVKLRDNTKKSRIKNFFKKFHFKKGKTKKPKPKRSANDNYYIDSPIIRRERFNPLKTLKNMFRTKEEGRPKAVVTPHTSTVGYDLDIVHMAYEPKFEMPMSVAELQKQIPNISDNYFELPAIKGTTTEKAVNYYKLDQKDHDLLYNYRSPFPRTKSLITSPPKGAKPIILAPVTVTKAMHAPIEIASKSSSTITKTREQDERARQELARVPPCNVITVNVKTMKPTKSSPILVATEKYDYKKNVPNPLQGLPEELSVRTKLTRFAKLPIGQRHNKMRRADDSEPDEIERDNLGFDGPSVHTHDFGSRNAVHSENRKAAVHTLKKLQATYKPNKEQKSVYPDYFSDLLMWHNDILNLESVPNPLWKKILNTLNTDTDSSFTTPDMKILKMELNEMNQFLGNYLNNSAVTVPTGSTEVNTKDRVGIGALGNQLDDVEDGVIRSVAMDDSAIVTSRDVFIKGEAKYFQYNKPKSPEALASSNFVMKLNTLNKMDDDQIDEKVKIKRKEPHRNSPTPTDIPAVAPIIVDTTLMAYDDDVDSINKQLEVKKSCKARGFKKSGKAPPPEVKTEHTSVLKTNKVPVQYYTTPLPMKAQDFHRFLKDHQMGVDFVTAPINLELPTRIDSSITNKKHTKGSRKTGETLASTTGLAKFLNNWITECRTTRTETIEPTNAGSKSSQSSLNMTALQSKLENITKTMDKLSKSTTQLLKKNRKLVNNSKLSQKLVNSSKNSYWSEDFDRYKRYNVLKITRRAAPVKNKATHEPKYYGIFKKKVKEKFTDKKVTEQVVTDHLFTESVTMDLHNKDVEITIINFDDLDKMSTPQTTETFALTKKDEIHLFTDFSDMVTTDTTLRPKVKITTQKEDINLHNELIYKDVFNERTTSTATTKEYLYTDLTKQTEFDPLTIRDGHATMNRLWYSFENGPISPNIFNKMPNAKNNVNMPKRVHITSHHYKYDIFYDDVKKMIKDQGGVGCGYSFKNCFSCRINEGSFGANGVEGEKLPETFYKLQPKPHPATSYVMNLSRKRAPSSEEGWNVAELKRQIMDRTHRNRHKRRVRGPEAPHKKRKHFTLRGCKSKPTGGLTQSKGYFEKPILTSSPGNSAGDSMPKLGKDCRKSMANTGIISLARNIEPVTDIEDLVTLLDKQDLGVTKSDIDAAVTLAALRTEFLTSYTLRDGARRALERAKPATVTTETPVTTTTPATTAATKITTTGSTKVRGPEAPHKKRKHFTLRGCKSKPTGGLTQSKGYFEKPILTSSPGNSAGDSMPKLGKDCRKSMANTGIISLSRNIEPVTDIEDLVTLLDKQDLGVTKSDIDAAVTLAALRTEFLTSYTLRDGARRALERAKPATVTTETPVTTTTPSTTAATKITTTGSTKRSSSPLQGSLIYDLKQLKKTTSSNKLSNDKEIQQGPQRDRHMRLSKFCVLHSHLKNFMKYLTMTTKRANVTSPEQATKSLTPQGKKKRTCFKYIPDVTTTITTERVFRMEPCNEVSTENEGFCITHHCECCMSLPLHKTTPRGRTSAATSGQLRDPDSPQHHCTHQCRPVKKKPLPKFDDYVMYMEPILIDNEIYVESLMSTPPIPPCEEKSSTPHAVYKREVGPNTFTAKDVAALEVIVDLLKNTLNDEENIANGFQNYMFQPITTTPINSNFSTNTIQVHIAIPYDYQAGKKRSPPFFPGPVRVRKVFSAKMSSPVDLEYQVNSIEGTIAPTSTKPAEISSFAHFTDSLTPGMYLLIDKPKDGFGLQPLLGKISWSDLKQRRLISSTTASVTEPKPTDSIGETTSLKNLARVTLSKAFVAAINQQLLELYENRSRLNKDFDSKDTRKARSVWRSWKLKENKERKKKGAEKYIVKRRIDWDVVKKYFGHDRVCNCKCKTNTAMCRACAASDAVIDELIFEFDNIGRYMADHCTEIQTFFWMNPIGGQKLRDSVNKIDRSLTDYFKRVKGKCQGRLCKTFSTYIDKRNFVKTAKIKKGEGISCLINDLATLAHDLNMTVALDICYNVKLKENGEKFINLMNNCINYKSLSKRSNPTATPKHLVKQVYSLDNINVNIICNPESPSTAYEQMMSATISPLTSPQQILESTNDHPLDFDLEERNLKKRKGFRGHFFPSKNKKSKLFSYFDFNKKHKRQVDKQASMPLISDGGGAFWYDYLKAGTNEPRLVRGSIRDTPTITVDVVQRAVTAEKVLKVTATPANNDLGKDTIYMTARTRPERNPRDTETTTDSLSRNIYQMLQLFGSLQDVKSMNNITNSNLTTNLPTDASIHRKVSQDTSKDKVKQKVNHALAKNRTTVTTNTLKTKKMTQKIPMNLEKKLDEVSTIEHTIETVTQQAATTKAMSDGASDNIAVISSITGRKVSANTSTTNNSSTTVSLAAESTALINTDTSTTVTIINIGPIGDKKSESTPVVKKTTTKFSFKNMIKAATKLFGKGQTQTPKKTTKISTTTELAQIRTDIMDEVPSSPANDYVVDENTKNTNVTPTILIINDYDSQVSNGSMSDDMKENYKNLLLSIIQFETNNLNNEWERIFYGGLPGKYNRDETDIKRSAPKTPVETKASIILTPKSTPAAAFSEEDTYSEAAPYKTSKTTESLLNKIASRMGLKVAKQKKVVKKPRLREPRKDSKRVNFIRKRKLRINNFNQETSTSLNQEACHTRRTTQPGQLCDIQATFKHIQNLQTSVPTKTFENLMKNVSCYQYRNADSLFIIPYEKRGTTWDWIRNKRSLKHFHNKLKDAHDFDDETYVVDFEDGSSDIFERFVKGDNGIYEIVKRKKRKVNLEVLERGLRNIPTLMPTEDELYVMVGDSVTLDCGVKTPARTSDEKFHWETDRKRMLEQDNVDMGGLTVAIHNVEPKNSGTYTCIRDHTVRKNVMLNVMDVPSFDVVFLPLYGTKDNCSYDDLIAIQRLSSLMNNETHCGKACSVRIDEPVCQKDRSTNNTMVRATAVISITPHSVNCSLQCRRDIQTSLVMLCATNAAILPSIPVEIFGEGVSEALTPCKDCVRPVVTHTLRKKDSNGHLEYRQLSSILSPGKVDVVILCPAGYYLLSKYKLCASCPPNTSSKAGENACRTCPRGTRAEPGAAMCHVVKVRHHRRYDWWWYPPCGYVVACCGMLFGCMACVLLSLIVHVVSRDAELPEHDGDDEEQTIPKPMMNVASAYFPGARPLSPSRVILPRFFRPSLTSSRATDSQETKFELWKERNMPPPLPPMDFDP